MCAIFFANWRFYMKLKKAITRLTALFMLLSFSSTTAFAGLNLGNDDGTGFSSGTSNNYWGVHTDSGISLNDTEGLRVTVYDATSNNKVFNTISVKRHSSEKQHSVSRTAAMSFRKHMKTLTNLAKRFIR